MLKSEKDIPSIRCVIPLPKNNHRIVKQQGLFILSLKSDLLRNLVACERPTRFNTSKPDNLLDKPLVGGYLIKIEDKNEILIELDLMGINEYTLFGGLDGACRHLKWKEL